MTTTLSDAELVAAHLAGDRTALAAIYDRYSAGLYDTAAAMLSDRHDAADMVQDVFCIAAERLGQLRDPERLKPWLYAVLRNEVYRRTKRRRRTTPTDFQSETVPDVVAPTDPGAEGASVAFAELASLVRAAAAGLDERDQLILELSIRQGLDGADLADALGVTPEQSYSMVHRMRERVDRSLGAFVVAKAGRRDCSTLDEILRDWDGEFNVLIRKRVARHIESCETCARTKGKVAPLALFGAAPVLAAPLGLRERVLEATSKIPTPSSHGGTNGGTNGGSGSTSRIRLRPSDGFPRASRILGRGGWWAIGVVMLVATGSVIMLASTDSAPASNDAANNDSSITIADGSPVTSTETTPTETPITTVAGITPLPTPPPTVSPSPESSTPVSPTNVPSTAVSSGTATTTIPRATTTKPSALVALGVSASALDFSTTGTTATLRLTNPNASAVPWKIASAQPSFFTFGPSAGTLAKGASVTITVTFARSVAASYSNSASFPEGRFDVAARVTATGAPTTTLRLLGSIGRPPQVGTIALRFGGASCANVSIQVPVSDESPLKSVLATATFTGGLTPATRTITLTDSGKGSWVGASTNIPGSTSAVSVSVTATDRNGLTTTAGTKVTRPSSC
jgi:RNA polymerase sigma factor (sigma-70 family)